MKFMKTQILGELINIDKVAYKEVNFKSKLIEWSQKNKVKMEFKLIENQKDKQGSPTFYFQVLMEGLPCGEGRGYSKKESQQEASKLTLQRLRREPQFIDEVFSAKASRTKMEEEPVLDVPETSQDMNFIVGAETEMEKHENPFQEEVFDEKSSAADEKGYGKATGSEKAESGKTACDHDFPDGSLPQGNDREAIIAAAEAEAFEAQM